MGKMGSLLQQGGFSLTANPTPSQIEQFLVYVLSIPSINAWSAYSGTFNGVKHHMVANNMDTNAWRHPRVQKVITGLQKLIGEQETETKLAKPEPQTCTPSLLKHLDKHFRTNYNTMAQRNAKRGAAIAAVAAFRLGELTATKHNKGKVPLFKHVKLDNSTIFLPFSKADKYNRGTIKKVPINSDISARNAMQECVDECHRDKRSNKPFLCDDTGAPLTAEHIMIELKFALQQAGIDSANFTTKCFRRGGASDLKKKGASAKQIRELGNWKTNQFKRYLDSRTDNETFDEESTVSKSHTKVYKVKRIIETRRLVKVILSINKNS